MITDISQLVAQAESSGRISAIRHEPAYRPDERAFKLAKIYHPGLSRTTYAMLLASSWGLYQIMGDNLFLLGLKVSLLDYWKDADMQAVFFHKYCASRNIAFTLEEILTDLDRRRLFARKYNGSYEYAIRLMQVYEQNKS